MDWTTPGLGLRIGGHRGAAGEAPENTFAAFTLAAAADADYVELDIQLAADGVALVFHDDDLERTTNGAGRFATQASADLLGLDAGSSFDPRFRAERIPTLDGLLAWLVKRPGLGATIEAKGRGTGAEIARAIAANPDWRDGSICSFSADELLAAASVESAIPRMLIVDRDRPDVDPIELARAARAGAVNVPIDWLTTASVARLHATGLLVAGGTVDDAAGIRACIELGIDFVDTNRPSVTVVARNALMGRGSAGS